MKKNRANLVTCELEYLKCTRFPMRPAQCVGLQLTRHAKCTASPWENTGCEHGRHGRPAIPRQANGTFAPPLKGKVVTLALNLLERHGAYCPSIASPLLHVGMSRVLLP